MSTGNFQLLKCRILASLLGNWRDGHYRKKYQSMLEEKTVDDAYADYLAKGDTDPDKTPKILFDVDSTRHYRKSLSGIQRVVWSVLNVLMRKGIPGYRLCPVYMSRHGLVLANAFVKEHFGRTDGKDRFFDYSENDIFVSLELAFPVLEYYGHFDKLREKGGKVFFFVYDLLPQNLPQYMREGYTELFERYCKVISRYDGIMTDSKAVADDYRAWRKDRMPESDPDFPIYWTHLGCDMADYAFTKGFPPESERVFKAIAARETCLMVSTVEPRKGYRQSLAAFETLWSQGYDANLIIVGRQGWSMEDFVKTLKTHPEANKRLFWLPGISDEYLNRLYQETTGVMMASEGEGFGLAVIECAAHGKPLLCRNLPVFMEIAGEHVTYFSDDSPQALADALKAWFASIKAGTNPDSGKIHGITWEQTADNVVNAILPKSSR